MEVEYALTANLELSDTPQGQGNGSYRIGPGTAVIRYEVRNGAPTGAVELVSYQMSEHFGIDAKTLFWTTHVKTDSQTTVGNDSCGVVARGVLSGQRLDWKSDIRGARTDGQVQCEGSLCGKFGAPPPGASALHVAPHDVRFQTWVFSPDMKRFSMAKTWMARSEQPKQTSHITLNGHEIGRHCTNTPLCGSR
jgi:hypothetical protein